MDIKEKHAKAIAQQGGVKKNEYGYSVLCPTNNGQDALVFTVTKNDSGKVECDCAEFKEHPEIRCEHILAVKHALLIDAEAANQAPDDPHNILDFAATLKELRKNVDPKLIKQREGWRDRNGNVKMVDYVEWHTIADILDDVAPDWAHTVKDIKEIGDIMTVTVAITIDGVTREGIGTGNAHNEMGIKKAEHDALKRAAVKFGIARDLYKKESDVIERGGSTSSHDDGYPDQPVARNLGELITIKQLGMVRALARELRLDADEECNAVMKCRTDELSKSAGSSFIKHLQEMQKGGPALPPDRMPLRSAS